MITGGNIYKVLSAVIPLYVAIFLGYASVRYWKLFSTEGCSAINRFVATFAVPLLCFQLVAKTDLYKLNGPLIAADTICKVIVLVILAVWINLPNQKNRPYGWAFDWSIIIFMVSALPNTLIIGIPLLGSMYGQRAESFMAQLVVIQTVVWFTLTLVALECRGAHKESLRIISASHKFPKSRSIPVNQQETVPEIEENAFSEELEEIVNSSEQQPVEEDISREHEETAQPMALGRLTGHDERRAVLKLALKIVLQKLSHNFTLWASLAGVIYSLLSFGLDFGYPLMFKNSIAIIGQTGLGMALFSLGLFSAQQSGGIMACGLKTTIWTSILRFFITPAAMAVFSFILGLRGNDLRIAIVQAALPQGIAPFVFANEYKVHPSVISTGVILGTLGSLPFLVAFYVLIGL